MRRSILAGFAGAVGLVAGCDGQRIAADSRARVGPDSAEHVMYNGSTIITANGVRRGTVAGDTVTTFDAVTRFQFHPLEVRFSTALGRPLAVMTAPAGEYSLVKGTLETTGSVTMVSDTTQRRVETRAVRYDAAQNTLASDSAFTATSGTRKLSGVGFTADPGLFTIKCVAQCVGSLGALPSTPPPARPPAKPAADTAKPSPDTTPVPPKPAADTTRAPAKPPADTTRAPAPALPPPSPAAATPPTP